MNAKKILSLLEKNARYTVSDLSVMLNMDESAVQQEIEGLQAAGIIRGYKTVVDWERLDSCYVSALIELKVTPQADAGFEDIAKKVIQFDEDESCFLMSGGYDLCVIVKGSTFHEVANFVGKTLAPMNSVISTATHFMLRRYKEMDVILCDSEADDRGSLSL